jgi:predicted dehydrogenase
MTRRGLIKGAAGGAAAVAISSFFTAKSWSQVLGSNEACNIGTIGFHGRGGTHIGAITGNKGFRLAGLCDVDSLVLEAHSKKLPGVPTYTDLRKMLDDPNLHAVSIATPNHWHSLAAIYAIQAGKDVYCEKPVSHNVSEGRRVVEFARKHNRIVQTGTQSRASREGILKAVEYVQAGKLGKVIVARGLCYKRRASIGKVDAPIDPPKGLDFNIWCGPAEMLPIRRKQFHYDWHWVWNTGNGDIGNQGIHEMDVARWFLGEQELSPSILSIGGRVGYVDDGETPNTMITYHAYQKAPLLFEVRGLPDHKYEPGTKEKMDKYKGADIGIVVECEGGHVTVGNYGSAELFDKDGKSMQKFSSKGGDGTSVHFNNFLQAVHSRKHEDLWADIEDGHLSSALCHTSNLSYRLGQQADPASIEAAIKDNPLMMEAWGRMKEHLTKNEVDINKDKLTLGAALKMDGKAERFIDNEAANAMLTRKYREPFVVPATVS